MNFIFKKLKKFIFLRIFFHFVYILAIASLPTVIKYMIDDSYSNGIYDIVKLTGIFVLLIVIGMGAQYVSQRSAWRLEKEFNLYFRENLFSVIICKEPSDFNKNSIGDYNSRLNNDIASCAEYLEYTMMTPSKRNFPLTAAVRDALRQPRDAQVPQGRAGKARLQRRQHHQAGRLRGRARFCGAVRGQGADSGPGAFCSFFRSK